MLVLSRKKGEAVNIADGVTVTVREISGSRVLLGFEAPSEVRIKRQELPFRASPSRSERDETASRDRSSAEVPSLVRLLR